MESSHDLSSKKIVEENNTSVKVRVTMHSGAAGHVMPETMFPRVKIERKTPPKKFVAANGEQIKDLGAKRIPFKTNEDVQRCIKFRIANVVKPFISMQKVVQAGNTVVLKRIRTFETLENVNNDVYTTDMWICLDETRPVFSWQESGQAAFDKLVKPGALCILGATGKKELNSIGDEHDDMSDEEGDRIADEGEFWRVRRNKPTQREREEHQAHAVPTLVCTLHDGKGPYSPSYRKTEE